MNRKRGFTLAELMIVLAILGIVSAILTPVIFDAMPDENKLKFKKAYYTMQRTTDAVLNSDVYPEGDLSKPSSPAKVFCAAFADMLNTIVDNCNASSGNLVLATKTLNYNGSNGANLDTYCRATAVTDYLTGTSNKPKFVTQDGIYWFGFDYDFPAATSANAKFNSAGMRSDYGVVCVDVDGPGGEAAFGFGVRFDGKIIVGDAGRTWLKEGVKGSVNTD